MDAFWVDRFVSPLTAKTLLLLIRERRDGNVAMIIKDHDIDDTKSDQEQGHYRVVIWQPHMQERSFKTDRPSQRPTAVVFDKNTIFLGFSDGWITSQRFSDSQMVGRIRVSGAISSLDLFEFHILASTNQRVEILSLDLTKRRSSSWPTHLSRRTVNNLAFTGVIVGEVKGVLVVGADSDMGVHMMWAEWPKESFLDLEWEFIDWRKYLPHGGMSSVEFARRGIIKLENSASTKILITRAAQVVMMTVDGTKVIDALFPNIPPQISGSLLDSSSVLGASVSELVLARPIDNSLHSGFQIQFYDISTDSLHSVATQQSRHESADSSRTAGLRRPGSEPFRPLSPTLLEHLTPMKPEVVTYPDSNTEPRDLVMFDKTRVVDGGLSRAYRQYMRPFQVLFKDGRWLRDVIEKHGAHPILFSQHLRELSSGVDVPGGIKVCMVLDEWALRPSPKDVWANVYRSLNHPDCLEAMCNCSADWCGFVRLKSGVELLIYRSAEEAPGQWSVAGASGLVRLHPENTAHTFQLPWFDPTGRLPTITEAPVTKGLWRFVFSSCGYMEKMVPKYWIRIKVPSVSPRARTITVLLRASWQDNDAEITEYEDEDGSAIILSDTQARQIRHE